MTVYLVRAGETDAVKIGHAKNISRRLLVLQSGNPFDLNLLRLIPGGAPEEQWLHRHFRHLRIAREWFRFSEDMLTIIPGCGERIDTAAVQSLIFSIERRGAQIGLRPAALCRLAGVNPTTWWRIREGHHGPQYSTLQKIQKLAHHRALESAA